MAADESDAIMDWEKIFKEFKEAWKTWIPDNGESVLFNFGMQMAAITTCNYFLRCLKDPTFHQRSMEFMEKQRMSTKPGFVKSILSDF